MTPEASEVAARAAAAPEPNAWSPLTVFWGVLAVLGVTVIAAVVLAAIDPDLDEETFGLIIQAAFAIALVAVPLLLISGKGRLFASPQRLGLRRFAVAQGLGWTFAAYGAFFLFLIAYGVLVQPDPQEIIEEIQQEEDTLKIVALGVLVVLAAPVSEEVFFRGFLFGGLRAKMSFWPAALISGLLFGLVHLPGGELQVPPLAVFGILLAWLYERTGSLGPPIVMHMIQNTISFTYTLSA
jgi:membrane protease YdiL (CAAX protease family)